MRPAVPPPSLRPSLPIPPLLETPNNTSLHIEADDAKEREREGEEGAKGAAVETVKQYLARPPLPSLLPSPSIHLTSLHSHSLPPSLTRALTAAFLATHARARRGQNGKDRAWKLQFKWSSRWPLPHMLNL